MLNGHIEYYFLPQYEMCQASSQQTAHFQTVVVGSPDPAANSQTQSCVSEHGSGIGKMQSAISP